VLEVEVPRYVVAAEAPDSEKSEGNVPAQSFKLRVMGTFSWVMDTEAEAAAKLRIPVRQAVRMVFNFILCFCGDATGSLVFGYGVLLSQQRLCKQRANKLQIRRKYGSKTNSFVMIQCGIVHKCLSMRVSV
jgi:hypothetical protein